MALVSNEMYYLMDAKTTPTSNKLGRGDTGCHKLCSLPNGEVDISSSHTFPGAWNNLPGFEGGQGNKKRYVPLLHQQTLKQSWKHYNPEN